MHAEDIDWTTLDDPVVPQAGDHLHTMQAPQTDRDVSDVSDVEPGDGGALSLRVLRVGEAVRALAPVRGRGPREGSMRRDDILKVSGVSSSQRAAR